VPELGKFLIIVGIVIVAAGVLIWSGFGGWIGHLPGDIRVERGKTGFYFPVVTCVVLSIVLSLLLSFLRR